MLRSNAKAAAKQSYFGDDAPVTVIPSYVGQALATPFKKPLSTYKNGVHKSMDHESFADQYRSNLKTKYEKAGRPCGKIF